jgi:hypothetical protein
MTKKKEKMMTSVGVGKLVFDHDQMTTRMKKKKTRLNLARYSRMVLDPRKKKGQAAERHTWYIWHFVP